MFTHKFNREEKTEQGVRYYFDFTNGTETYTDACIPQDKEGLKFWIISTLNKYNTQEELKSELVEGESVDLSDTTTTPTLTQAEIDRNKWLEKYHKWVRVKQTVIDTGIIPMSNPKAVALLDDLKATLKPEYLDFI